MKREYREGPRAKQNFERTMKTLFRASKPATKKKEQDKPAPNIRKDVFDKG